MLQKGGACKAGAILAPVRRRSKSRAIFCIIRRTELRGISVATYQELREQAEKLMAEAERMREQEIADAIADIKRKIELYGLTAADLGFAKSGPGTAARGNSARSSKAPIKYRGPNGETWSGGRGRKPQWVAQVLKEGRDLEEFAVKNGR
jgi:DNA-binding protein H-NS